MLVERPLDLTEPPLEISTRGGEQRAAARARGKGEGPIKLAAARGEHVRQPLGPLDLAKRYERFNPVCDEEGADRLSYPYCSTNSIHGSSAR
jgi:hypothetical protein